MTMPPQPPDPTDRPPPGGTWSGLPPEAPDPRPVRRPGTVTAAAVILYVSAGLATLGCCALNVLAGEASGEESMLLLLAAGLLALGAALNAVLAYFVLQGRQWARIVTIVLCGLAVLVAGGQALIDAETAGLRGCVGILVNGLVIYLLSTEAASEFFRQSG